MRVTKTTCDRCGESATEWVRIWRHQLASDGLRCDAHDITELDLCPACAGELGLWMEVRPRGGDKVDS